MTVDDGRRSFVADRVVKSVAMRSVDEILEDALALPAEARAEIASSLIDSLDNHADPQAEELWAAEIERRIAEIDSGRVQLVPAD